MVTTQEPTKAVHPGENAGQQGHALVEACPTRLTGELARESLPQDAPDPNAKFAWANAICALFVVIGIVGICQPLFVLSSSAASKKPFIVPVLFHPPPPQPTVSQAVASDSAPQENTPEPVEVPDIVPAVTPMNAQINFAVPVEGPVRLVAAKYAVPPPANLKPAPASPANNGESGGAGKVAGDAVEFKPTLGDGGTYPDPEYPALARQRGWQGRIVLDVYVDARGIPYAVSVAAGSRYKIFEEAALDCVKGKWRFPVGPERHYLVPFSYKLSSRP